MKEGEGEGEASENSGEAYPCRRSRPSRSRRPRGPVALGRARRLGLLRVGPWFFLLGFGFGCLVLGKGGKALMGVDRGDD